MKNQAAASKARVSKKLHKDKLFARVKATSSLMCCHVEKRSRSEMPRRDHLLSNASLLPCHDVQKPCKQRVKACKKILLKGKAITKMQTLHICKYRNSRKILPQGRELNQYQISRGLRDV